MKTIIIAFLSLLISNLSYSQSAYIKIDFVKNYDNIFYSLGDDYLKFNSDTGNSFYTNLSISKPSFLELVFKDKSNFAYSYIPVYIYPGDSLFIEAYNDRSQFRFFTSGKCKYYNEALSDYHHLNKMSNEGFSRLFNLNNNTFNILIKNYEDALRKSFADNIKSYKIRDKYFINTVNDLINYTINSCKFSYSKRTYSKEEIEYYSKSNNVNKPELLIFESFRNNVNYYINYKFGIANHKNIVDQEDLGYMKTYLYSAKNCIENEKVRNMYLISFMKEQIRYIYSDPKSDDVMVLFDSLCTDGKEKKEIWNVYYNLKSKLLKNGDPMPVFSYEQINGEKN